MDATAATAIIRGASLLVPVALTAALWTRRRPDRGLWAGILLSAVWNTTSLLGLQIVAQRAGWWRFNTTGGEAFGVPVDLLLGWVLLWSAVPLLASPHAPLAVVVTAAALVDVALMPALAPVVELGATWLTGEAVALGVCLVPGLLIGRWTAAGERLRGRAALQVVLAGGLVFWLLPAAAMGRPDGMAAVLGTPRPASVIAAVVLGIVSLVGVAAVCEFVERGGGTPLPYDPPRKLVRSGPYAYCRNPMQTTIVVIFTTMAAVSGNVRLAAAALVALAYGAGLAVWHEEQELPGRFGWPWAQYRVSVRAWRFRLLPAPSGPQATIWIGRSCDQCRPVARFLLRRTPTRLDVRAAEDHPGSGLRRITYEAEGMQWHGVAAAARALEHLHLGWAVVGWTLRLPGLEQVVQLVLDAVGGGPRLLPAAARVPAD